MESGFGFEVGVNPCDTNKRTEQADESGEIYRVKSKTKVRVAKTSMNYNRITKI